MPVKWPGLEEKPRALPHCMSWWTGLPQKCALVRITETLNPGTSLPPVLSHNKLHFPHQLSISSHADILISVCFIKSFFSQDWAKKMAVACWEALGDSNIAMVTNNRNSNNIDKDNNRNRSHLWGFYYVLTSLHELPRNPGNSLRK